MPGGARRPSGCCSSVKTARPSPRSTRWSNERPNALGRLHALWTLELLSSLDAQSIELGLADPEPRVREAVIRLAEGRLEREPVLLDKTLALADDPDPMVRFQLAFSLGEVKNDPACDRGTGVNRQEGCYEPMDTDGGAELDRRRLGHARIPRRPSQSKKASSQAVRPKPGSTSWRFWSVAGGIRTTRRPSWTD